MTLQFEDGNPRNQYSVPEFIFYQAPPRIHALLLWNYLSKEIIFPQTYNLFNKLFREIVTLARKPLFFLSLHENETGLIKK